MTAPPPRRLPLPRRFGVAVTEQAYARLRALNEAYGLSNNYLLVVLLERLDDIAAPDRLDAAFREFIDTYGSPSAPSSQAGQSGEPRKHGDDQGD